MKKLNLLFLAIIILSTSSSCQDKHADLEDGIYAEIMTNKGTAIAKLFYDQTPMTVANFISLAEGTNEMVDSTYKGKKYYDGIIFHRVIKDFMIQTGDPKGTGTGGPGYKFPDEFVDSLTHKSKGILSMANSGPNTNGSQFFITLKETPHLDGRHSVFGEIVKGQDIIDSIGNTSVNGSKPKSEIKMTKVTIIRKGATAKAFDIQKAFTDKIKVLEAEKAEKEKAKKEAQKETAAKYAALKEKATQLKDGLAIHFIEKGKGPQPKQGDKVTLFYAGFLEDGTVFDTNNKELAKKLGVFNPQRAAAPGGYDPMPMLYSAEARMIPGFRDGVMEMKVGDKAVIFIPSALGYGERGGGPIPPNSDLIFDLEMVGIADK